MGFYKGEGGGDEAGRCGFLGQYKPVAHVVRTASLGVGGGGHLPREM